MVIKMKNKKLIILLAAITILTTVGIVYFFNIKNSNLIELNYNEVKEKINNKENFILCISANECIHCQKYKPKLKKIANDYNIKIYYINRDEIKKEKYEEFKKELSFDGGTPTTIFFKEGKEQTTASRIEGNEKTEKIINKLKSNGFITE